MRYWKILIPGVLVVFSVADLAIAQGSEPTDGPAGGICRFVDEDGDGFNDLAPDADGDGIPNGLDPDYVRTEDGEGQESQHSWAGNLFTRMFGRIEMYQSSAEIHGPATGPGMNSGFGPGETGGNGSSGGQGQAQQAGRRGGRR